MKIPIRYFGVITLSTKKFQEEITVKDGMTVAEIVEELCNRYGSKFREYAIVRTEFQGKIFYTPNVYLNSKSVHFPEYHPLGMNTVVKEGDYIEMGLISGGG